jgi:hypothetical protein
MADIDGASREDIEKFAAHLVDDTTDQICGAHIENSERTPPGFTPRTKFFAGALVPEEKNPSIDSEIQSRTSPSTLTLIGRVTDSGDGETVSIEVQVSFSLYYRVIPTPSERLKSGKKAPIVYRKYELQNVAEDERAEQQAGVSTSIEFTAQTENTGFQHEASEDVERELNSQIREAVENHIETQPDLHGGDDQAVSEYLSSREEMENEEFLAELEDAAIGGSTECTPTPEIGVDIRLLEALDETTPTDKGTEGTAVVRVDLTNKSDEDADFSEVDLATYETQLALRGTGDTEFLNMVFEEVPDGFRYDPSVPGQGENCTVERTEDGDGIRSETLPVYEQPYFGHRRFSGEANPRFDTLAEDPLPVLRGIRGKLKSYKESEWEAKLQEARAEAENPDSDPTVKAIKEDIEEFEREIERYKRGVTLLEEDSTARELFKNVNRVFLHKVRKGDPRDETAELEYPGWRPFQAVFIVSLLPDIMHEERDFDEAMHSRDTTDLLYFPTGGGKTEAYLALLVFTALFDRHRGKEFGLSAMMRFPLRLLSLQQFQRVVEILVHADEVRKEEGYGGEPLSAGFFTGNTENSLIGLLTTELDWNPRGDYPQDKEQLESNRGLLRDFQKRWNQVDGHDLEQVNREDYRTVENCPLCGSEIDLVFSTETDRVEHHCSSESCEREKLNVHVTDIDIYRGVPTIVLGTQDKLAALGYNYRFRTLAGYVSHRCPEHGYTHRHDECQLGFFCGRDNPETQTDGGLEAVDPYDPVPSLCLQDELHLINEDLGTFESHYYSAYEQHLEWASESQGFDYTEPKKIAATATIEESDNQVKHLYGGKETTLFPAPGPEYRESAYTTTDEEKTQRHYIGIVPWNRSQINSILRVLEMHQRRMQDWIADPAKHMQKFDFDELSDPDDFENLLSHYYTLVTYVISKFEGGRVLKSTETQVSDNLSGDGYDRVERFDMQGNTDADEMANMLKQFEQIGTEGGTTHEHIQGLITATSSISHGVDLDALGFMVFFNAPPRMSEYIQASSRVGRKHPGVILDMFDPIGERDRSHYHYFHKYHEYMDRLVEPVAINRWAKFSVKRTFPGLFMSLLKIRYFDELSEELGYFKNNASPRLARKAERAGVLDQDQLMEDLKSIYGEDWETGLCPFEEQIEQLVQQSFNRIGSGAEETISDCLTGRVMLSLRDVDEPIDIRPSYRHEDAFRASGVDI